jgi:hypothetical protein
MSSHLTTWSRCARYKASPVRLAPHGTFSISLIKRNLCTHGSERVQLENIILTSEAYPDICTLALGPDGSNTGACKPPSSPLLFFYGMPTPGEGFPEREMTQVDIDATLADVADNLYANGAFFDRDFGSDMLTSKWSRSFYTFGLPRPGYESVDSQYVASATRDIGIACAHQL